MKGMCKVCNSLPIQPIVRNVLVELLSGRDVIQCLSRPLVELTGDSIELVLILIHRISLTHRVWSEILNP